ncbi:penicillin acylase family protein [Georgenia sp. M64]|uniref:penicillin acylase family protein n=1 Tax=Georgenia sp. M64 TaxID=3120520 RepID=UPI0030E173D1
MSVVRKVAIVVAALVVVVLVVGAGLATVLVRRPLPDHAGAATLDSLGAEVEIIRDERGVAHLYGSSDTDLMRAQGYVHAQDRFFEMDYRRHVTAGRLSELVGENDAALNADSAIRTMGWRHVAEQEWDLLGEESRALYEAYAEGVNAYLDRREASELGLEYTILGMSTELRPVEPWTPVDSIAWLKAMAWDLSGNLDDEIGRAAALRPLAGNVARVEELYPEYAYEEATPIVAPQGESVEAAAHRPEEPGDASDAAVSAASAALGQAAAALRAVPGMLGQGSGIGSNSFVVSGEHTTTGAPLLANDPHMALPSPSLWTQVGLHCTEPSPTCTFDVTGVSFSGLPGVIIGRNPELAWGLTTLPADVTDLTLERLYDDGTYLRDGERVALETRRETIEVNGGASRVITVSATAHGPIVSEVLPDVDAAGSVPVPEGAPPAGFSGYAVALQWTALTPGRTPEAIFALNRATTAEEVAAAAALLEVPSQNIVFATADGDIGYQAPGRIPVRGAVPDSPVPSDGSWPRPGWDPRFDWQGFVPAEQMPAVLNPGEGFVVAANQAVMPAGEGPFLTSDWSAGYRSERIRTILEGRIAAGEQLDVAAMNEIMLDDASPFGPAVVPALLQVDIDDPFVSEAVDELRTWSAAGFPTSADSSGAAYFNAVWANLLDLTFADDLPASQAPDGGGRWLRVITNLLEDPSNPWWDDRTTVNLVEGRDEILRQAMFTARQQLTNSLGKDAEDWEWGNLHRFAPQHPVLGGQSVPAAVRRLVNPAPIGVAGGGAVVNATHYDASARDDLGRGEYTVTAGPAVRLVADLAEPDASTWVISTGTSGHPGADAYTDQLRAWAQGETYPWPSSREAVEEVASATLTLRPPE